MFLSQFTFLLNLAKGSIEKITKMSHKTAFFRGVFNFKCIFLFARLDTHAFIYLFIKTFLFFSPILWNNSNLIQVHD